MFYECKNDIGVDRTYHLAKPGFQRAFEVASKVLDFLYQAALQQDDTPIDRVITCRASFQVAQREDTVKAARLAGIKIKSNDLMDEPVAAFLEYMMSRTDQVLLENGESKNLVVFDFGGGTCDVAVFRISKTEEGVLNITSLSVSRYHRIGGGDIDRSIIHDCLIPQILGQNNFSKFDLSFDDKRYLEPLLGIAES